MRIEYTLREQDFATFWLYHYDHSPTCIRQHRRLYFGIPIMLVLAGLLLGLIFRTPVPPAIVALAAVFFLWRSPKYVRRKLQKQALEFCREGENRSLFGEHIDIAEPEGLRSFSPNGDESMLKWSSIERIETSDNHLYLYVGAMNALVVPEETVSAGSYSEFRAECERRTGQHRAPPTTTNSENPGI